ncbi:MAG: stage III sporulation protein AD [Clostridia bacterium]|nr:stage III sporulation protein AD [Clostridia bacterium]
MNIIQIVSLSLVATILVIILKQYRPEFSILISLIACIFVVLFAFEKIQTIISMLNDLIFASGINKTFFEILIKITGIAYIVELASNLCADAGEKAIASKVEFAGKVLIVTMSVPIITTLIETITEVI